MIDFFDDYSDAQIWYHPIADRLFIFHKATFLMLPCLEREDGFKLICQSANDVNVGIQDGAPKLDYIGDL